MAAPPPGPSATPPPVVPPAVPPDHDVLLAYTKHDGTRHWEHRCVRLGRDEHGTWLGMAAGAPFRRGDEPWRVTDVAGVLLVPDDAWWCLLHNGHGTGHRYPHYVDVCTPATWVGDDTVTMVDLDLDVVEHEDGRVEVVDRDEFDAHRVRYGYPADVVGAAEEAAAWVAAVMRAGREPFATTAGAWRARLLERHPG
ncbi:MAG: DUF402 domain-containing protein [Actinomycetes bacterium]